jgi:ATP-dependent RNA helicase DeaD
VLKLDGVKWLVLDEADEMLNMGFKEELDAIISKTPEERQTLLFSATMSKEISSMANRYMKERDEISIGHKNAGAANVNHVYYQVHAKDRYETLKRIADIYPGVYGIVFCRTRQETKEVADKFIADGYNAEALHGDLSQVQRDMVMSKFRQRHLQLLIATDVAARGIDVNDLTHVINYNLPDDPEIYIHRSGRTGRAGKSGTSIIIINAKERGRLKDIERIGKISFERAMVPNGPEICQKQLLHTIDRIEQIEVNEDQIGPFLPEIYKKLEWMDREELIKRFVSVEFNTFLKYYENAPDLNIYEDQRGQRQRSTGSGSFQRMFINIGKAKNLTPPMLFSILEQYTGKRGIDIGRIEILRNFSFFELDPEWVDPMIKAFKNARYNGENIFVEPAENAAPDNQVRERKPFERRGSESRSQGKPNREKPTFDRKDKPFREQRTRSFKRK